MTKRARWLVVLGFLLPGSAQILSGKSRFGRFGLGATLLLWGAVLLAILLYFINRAFLLTVAANTYFLLFIQCVIVIYALLWVLLGFDTLRLAQVPKVAQKWRMPVILLSLVLTSTPVVTAVWGFNAITAGRDLINAVFANKQPSVPAVNGRYNILLLGVDAGVDREGLRPDSISLVSIDATTGQSVIIGLPRELARAQFAASSPMHKLHPAGFGVTNGCATGRCWLNSIYAEVQYFMPELYGTAAAHASSPGIEATKDAVSGTTGLAVQFFVLLNMDGFTQLIDALGGVDIDVAERLPIGGDELGNGVEGYIEPGAQHLNGWEALWYVRSRYGSAQGDYDRMARQRELQSAILRQMTPQNVIPRFQEIVASGSALAETDIPAAMLGYFTDLVLKAKEHEIVRVELVPPAIITEDPDFVEIRRLVQAAVTKASKAGVNQ